jgi:hypothetical protein
MMKQTFLLALLAVLSPTEAFHSLAFSSNVLVTTRDDSVQKRRRRAVPPIFRGQALRSTVVPVPNNDNNQTSSLASFVGQTGSLSEARQQQLTLVGRSSLAALATVATWALVQYAGLTIVQASSLQGLLGCLVLPKPYSVAWFCGSFAGMSSQPLALDEASLLAACCSVVFYQFERHKLAVGRGGRLGLVAFLSNLVYAALRQGPRAWTTLAVTTLQQVRPVTAMSVGVLALALTGIRRRSARAAASAPGQAWLKGGVQATMLTLLVARLLTGHTAAVATTYATTALATFGASWLTFKSPYTVFPVAALGTLAGFLAPSLAPAVYMGAFIGMTGLAQFEEYQFVKASAFAAVLLNLGLLGGFGGRLGFLAYVGVNFGL